MGTSSYYHRETCRLCDSKNIFLVIKLEPIPLPDKYLNEDEIDCVDETFPVDLYMCNSCSHVQLLDVINPEILWDSDFTYHSGRTLGLIEHFVDVANKIVHKYKPKENSLVLDVGSNDGSLLQCFKNKGFRVLGVDPAKDIAQKATDSGIETIPELLTLELSKKIKKDFGEVGIITAFNVFSHDDNMSGMAESISSMLAADGIFQFEVHYLLDVIENVSLGTIFHEHLCHHSLIPMVKFLNRHEMELIDVERVTIQRGSIIGTAQRIAGPRKISPSVNELLTLEKEKGLDRPDFIKGFSSRLKLNKEKISQLIEKCKSKNSTIAGFGAARSGPTFITQLDIGDVISFIVDDHPDKVNRYTPGHHIPVYPIDELYNRMPDYVIILSWVHTRKIIKDNKRYLEQGGHFITLYPEIEVIDLEKAIAL